MTVGSKLEWLSARSHKSSLSEWCCPIDPGRDGPRCFAASEYQHCSSHSRSQTGNRNSSMRSLDAPMTTLKPLRVRKRTCAQRTGASVSASELRAGFHDQTHSRTQGGRTRHSPETTGAEAAPQSRCDVDPLFNGVFHSCQRCLASLGLRSTLLKSSWFLSVATHHPDEALQGTFGVGVVAVAHKLGADPERQRAARLALHPRRQHRVPHVLGRCDGIRWQRRQRTVLQNSPSRDGALALPPYSAGSVPSVLMLGYMV